MRFPSDEELLQEFRNKPDAQPRAEFMHSLERALLAEGSKQHKRQKIRRLTIRMGISAVFLFAILWVTTPFIQTIINHEMEVTKPTAIPLVTKNQKLKLEDISTPSKKTLAKILSLVPELKELEADVYGKEDGVYEITFDQKVNGKERVYASVELHAGTGRLLGFDCDTPSGEQTDSTSEEVARQKSAAFLQELIGDELARYKVGPISNNDWTSVRYDRYVNNIPVINDYYVVGVNKYGNVTYVNVGKATLNNIGDEGFPAPAQAIPKEEIEKNLTPFMELFYEVDPKKARESKLYYSPNFSSYLDALTGREVEDELQRTKDYYSPIIDVTPGGRQIVAKSSEQVAKVLTEEFHIDVQGMTFTVTQETTDSPQKTYHARLNEKNIEVYTVNDLLSGFQVRKEIEVLNEIQHDNTPANARITVQEAEKKAITFLQPYLNQQVKQLKIKRGEYFMTSKYAYSFSFYVIHDGIPAIDQQYLVNVDGRTGEIVNFMDYFSEPLTKLPNKREAVSKEAVAKEYLTYNPLVLHYLFPTKNGQMASRPMLVYMPNDVFAGRWIDAFSGKMIER
ncbi:YcdB/YcdC domain-containing protein [Brevibacillus laterosporus]|uniref:YcdB/YcdC domain-containing protein n=1 Tax=Brevibacillus laterosporus TaxID=1465 RepID=UPI002655AC2C|nr:YcdB/YcdC domain-containing protein [Brevibacillus laterosporus]MDN9011773.1 hypothetical protein [Brevibacillus laterosporus]MDO0942773.1 hypothetical protein [Brevibacillus laterosporus]